MARQRKTYHHGDLRNAMIAATVALVEEAGPEGVTVREAARRAGVSSGAPFRHFPSKQALMTAVAEEAMRRLKRDVDAAMRAAAAQDPLQRFRALGIAYLRWALGNPTHFRVISDRQLIDFAGSEVLVRDNGALEALMAALLAEAEAQGLLRPMRLRSAQFGGRALAYGLARMAIDGHLPQAGIARRAALAEMTAALDGFLAGLAAPRAIEKPRNARRGA